MAHCYCTSRNLPFLTDFSAKDRQLAEQVSKDHDERQRKAADSRSQKADEIVDDLRRRLRDLLGKEKFTELRKAMKHERLAFRDLWQPPEGLGLDYATLRKERKAKIDALVRKLGTSPEELRKIAKESHERLQGILAATDGKVTPGYNLARNLDTWLSLSPLHVSPLPWGTLAPPDYDPNDPHRWFLFRPPFFGFTMSFTLQRTGNFLVDRLLFLAPAAGLVGHEVTMDDDDAGDFDVASGTAVTVIGFGFEAPTTGLVEVLIDAQSGLGTHDLSMEDEFGFSSSWTNQNNYLIFNVLHPNVPEPSLALMSNFYGEYGGDNTSEHRENLTRGQHYFAHLFSSGPVPGGQSVVVVAGTRTFDIAHADDVKVHSKSNFQWFISSVDVSISP